MQDIIKTIDGLKFESECGEVTLSAWEEDGKIAVEAFGPKSWINKEAIGDRIQSVPGFPIDKLEWVESDESASIAWWRVRA